MVNATIQSIPNQSELFYLGNCFRSKSRYGSWYISARYVANGERKRQDKTFDFGLMPVLGLHKYYDKDASPRFIPQGEKLSFTIPSINKWNRHQLIECPLMDARYTPYESRPQIVFNFQANGVSIWLPALELARAMFFASASLARLSLQPDSLNESFLVNKRPQGVTEISMLPGANFPKYYFQDKAYQTHLAWLLNTDGIKRSYESIYLHRIQQQKQTNFGLQWQFDFSPPDLSGTMSHSYGQFDANRKHFFLHSIAGLENLPSDVDGEVHFIHPDLKNAQASAPPKNGGRARSQYGEMEINAEEEASINNHHYIAPTPAVGLSFNKPIRTKRIKFGKRQSAGGGGSTPTSDQVTGSVGEGNDFGSLPQADFAQIETGANNQILEERFSLFKKLIELLELSSQITILDCQFSRLPILPRCTMHLCEDGTPRCYMCVAIRLPDETVRHIIEVDTSDAKKALGTKVIQFNAPLGLNISFDPSKPLQAIMTELVRRSLTWPNDEINKHCSFNQSISHPKSDVPGQICQQSLEHWRDRVLSWVLRSIIGTDAVPHQTRR